MMRISKSALCFGAVGCAAFSEHAKLIEVKLDVPATYDFFAALPNNDGLVIIVR